jgi:hypothetical protein
MTARRNRARSGSGNAATSVGRRAGTRHAASSAVTNADGFTRAGC